MYRRVAFLLVLLILTAFMFVESTVTSSTLHLPRKAIDSSELGTAAARSAERLAQFHPVPLNVFAKHVTLEYCGYSSDL